MNCVEWEDRVSLYAGGDLPAAEMGGVERHLADCPGCQIFLSGVTQSLALLRELHGEPIAPAHLAAVRARVISQLESDRLRWRRISWLTAAGLAAAALIGTIALEIRHVPLAPLPVAVHHAPSQVAEAKPPAVPVIRRVRAARRLKRRTPALSEPLIVKLVTDNPDVVIYWIADKRGE